MLKGNSFFKIKQLLLLFIVTVIVILFLNFQGIFYPIRQAFLYVAHPFQEISYGISNKIANVYIALTSIAKLKKQNEELIKKNNRLLAQVANMEDQKKENVDLRKQLHLAPRDKYNLETALVVGQDLHNLESWIIIDKGSVQGIKKGMPVIVDNGILIGKISETYINSSKIILLTDPHSSVNVVDSKTGAKGILNGKYGLGLIMNMVEQTEVLNLKDKIITSDLGGIFPRGLLIGNIQQIDNTPDKLFQQAVITPIVNYTNLRIVSVIKNKK